MGALRAPIGMKIAEAPGLIFKDLGAIFESVPEVRPEVSRFPEVPEVHRCAVGGPVEGSIVKVAPWDSAGYCLSTNGVQEASS